MARGASGGNTHHLARLSSAARSKQQRKLTGCLQDRPASGLNLIRATIRARARIGRIYPPHASNVLFA